MKKKKTISISKADAIAIRQVRILIESSPSEAFPIHLLSLQTGMNRNKLVIGFRLLFKQSIHQLIIATRMKAARSMLIHSDRPIKEIAVLSGYSSAANFITAFKKYWGKTPGEFQRRK